MDTTSTENRPQKQTATLRRGWVIKCLVMAFVGIGLGIWGTADAFWIYPDRGRLHAQFMLRDYLQVHIDERVPLSRAEVEDPAAELARLDSAPPQTQVEAARSLWLTSLSRLYGDLSGLTAENRAELDARDNDPAHEWQSTRTLFADTDATLDQLNNELAGERIPKPLAFYDIPSQYLFIIFGFGWGLFQLALFAKVAGQKFTWEPAERALTFPDGLRITPADVEELDKRKWDKFIVFVQFNDERPERKVDLYRHEQLEPWLLEVEKHTAGYEPEEEHTEADDAETEEASDTPASDSTDD